MLQKNTITNCNKTNHVYCSVFGLLYGNPNEGEICPQQKNESKFIEILLSFDHIFRLRFTTDYYDKGGRITIELFNDRVEVTNPGGLVSSIAKNEFGK